MPILMETTEVRNVLQQYRAEVRDELSAILSYWMQYTVDNEHGGFYGKVSNTNEPDKTAPKGIVLYSRILWTFSSAYLHTQDKQYLVMADRAYQYINEHFIDKEHGGVYWMVSYSGEMMSGKKQVYGLAFCLYGLIAYFNATQNREALQTAKGLFYLIEKFSFDTIRGGYVEAFTRSWELITDLRLSEKDANEKKTMNTHLHIIEAYTALFTVWQDDRLKERMIHLLEVFDKYIINHQTFHLNLFMDEDWKVKSGIVSFGHDIEASWLLPEAAAITRNEKYIERFNYLGEKLAGAAGAALDKDGGIWYEYLLTSEEWIKEKHWWPQAEAMVGFFNAWEISGNKKYLDYSVHSWQFIKKYLLDKEYGEWFWGIKEDYAVMTGEDKAGFWKCPYHNGRACLEIIKRIDSLKTW